MAEDLDLPLDVELLPLEPLQPKGVDEDVLGEVGRRRREKADQPVPLVDIFLR